MQKKIEYNANTVTARENIFEKKHYDEKEEIICILKKSGLLMEKDGLNIVDINLLKALDGKSPSTTRIDGKFIQLTKKRVFDALSNMDVISLDDFNANQDGSLELHTKPLFNIPGSEKEAFDAEHIKKADAYLNFWDLYNNSYTNYNVNVFAKNGDKIDLKAWRLASILINKYNLHRDDQDKLKIIDPETGEELNMTGKFIQKNIGHISSSDKKRWAGSIHEFMSQHPMLLKYDIFRRSDFRVVNETAKLNTRKVLDFANKDKDYYNTNGVRYYIGKKAFIYSNETEKERISKHELQIVELDPNTAGIIRNTGKTQILKYTFPYLTETEVQLKHDELQKEDSKTSKWLGLNTFVKAGEMVDKIKPWNKYVDNPQWMNESQSDYLKRLDAISSYQQIDEAAEKLNIMAGVNIHNLSWREQQWIATFHYQYETRGDIKKLYAFGKRYGLDGLKTFLNGEYDLNIGKDILMIGEILPEDAAQKVFKKTNEILDGIEKHIDEIEASFDFKFYFVGYKLHLFKKTSEIITKFSESINGKNDINFENMLADLENSKTEIIILASAIRAAKENGEKIDMEKIKDLDCSIKDFGQEFSGDEPQDLRIMAQRNYNGDILAQAALDSLDGGLINQKKQKFYTFMFRKKVVSGLRFEQMDEKTYYWGSFNTDPDARGLGLGDKLMEKALDEEAKDHILVAAFSPLIPVGCNYVEKMGHVIDGFVFNYHNSGRPLFMMRRDEQQNKKYSFRNEGKEIEISEDDLKRQCADFEMLDHLIGSESIVLKFDMKNEEDFKRMCESSKKLLLAKNDAGDEIDEQSYENKYRVTRYFRDNKDDREKDVRYFVFEKI